MGVNYKEMVEQARKAGITSEKIMWESIESFSELLDELKEERPDLYWEFMRKQQGILYHGHYNECFAMYDVSQMHYTNKQGEKRHGAYWTVEQIEEATAGMKFPPGTSKFDKFVAYNAIYADMCKDFDDASILKIAYAFFFADEDWGSDTKVWEYMSNKPHK